MKCPKCGSERIEVGVAWGSGRGNRTAPERGRVGLLYKVNKYSNFPVGVHSDLCLDCGTVLSTYIQETTDKEWMKEDGLDY
ncbi:MAG: hypothetical protein FWD70_04410 [Desulfuromonadales bacterium]|nr:hypothetical protein [Desulfuromonadales bacterium]